MAKQFLLIMKLKTQGDVKGSSPKKGGYSDTGVICHGFQFGVESPVDIHSGSPSGRRTHSPLTIRKEIDSASPLLLQAHWMDEAFDYAKLQFDKVGPDGKTGLARTIELTDGYIIKIKPAPSSGGKKYEDVTLTYETLHVNGIPNGLIPHSHLF